MRDHYVCQVCRARVEAPWVHRCTDGGVHVGRERPLAGAAEVLGRVVTMTAPYENERTVIAAVPPAPEPPRPGKALSVCRRVECDRCGGVHPDLVLTRLRKPVKSRAAKVAFNFWAPCPETGEPVLLLLLT